MGYTLPPGIFYIDDSHVTLKKLLPSGVNIGAKIDGIRLRPSLKKNQTFFLPKKSALFRFYTKLGFPNSNSNPLEDLPKGILQKVAGTNRSEKPNIITGSDKVHVNCDYKVRSIVKGVREPIIYKIALDHPPRHKIYETPRSKLFKISYLSVSSQETVFSKDDDHKPVDFNGETIFFTGQLIKIQ